MLKNRYIVMAIVVIFLVTFTGCSQKSNEVVYLENSPKVTFADVYEKMTAVIAEDGNCYIRGSSVSESTPFGVKNVSQYIKQYDSLDVSKVDNFVQIYSGNNAISIELSSNGGAIVTKNNEVWLFADVQKYKTPNFFCNNAVSAKLHKDEVYILTQNGELKLFGIDDPDKTVLLCNDVVDFKVMEHDESIWVLTADNELVIFRRVNDVLVEQCKIENIVSFDGMSLEYNRSLSKGLYSVGMVSNQGITMYYKGYGYPESQNLKRISTDNKTLFVSAYSKGLIVTDENNDSFVYGADLISDDTYSGNLLAQNVINVSAGRFGLSVVSNENELISIGLFPSSKYVAIGDIIN